MTTSTQLPIRVDFVAYRGDDWTRMFEPVYDNAGVGTALDMTGWTGRMHVREAPDGPILAEASSANGQVTTGPQSGSGRTWQLLVYLTAAQTAALPAGFIGQYDIELTKPDGKIQSFYYGSFCCEGDVTK